MHSLYNMIVIFPTYLVFLELACRMRVKGIRVYYSLLCFSFTHLILRCPCSSLCVLYIVHILYYYTQNMFCILTRVFQFHVFISTTLLLYIQDIYVLHIIQVVFNVFSIIMCITDSVLLKQHSCIYYYIRPIYTQKRILLLMLRVVFQYDYVFSVLYIHNKRIPDLRYSIYMLLS